MPKRFRDNDNSSGNVTHFAGDHDAHTRSSGESEARETWKRGRYIYRLDLRFWLMNCYTVARIARRAGGDDEDSPDEEEEEEEEITEEQRAARRQKKQEERLALKSLLVPRPRHAGLLSFCYL
jgi:hypothetical protein